ncbi:MAG: RnfH family protein [Pseudomonadales bacterium]|jgi:putative ubiquitin-RnfH superfamily antitoxin RatB of RatAB toxin-antitoxin module|nr:RnfH family protein [Pseudomonadales bacterium]
MAEGDLEIEVAFAGTDEQSVVKLCVADGTTARAAVTMSGLPLSFPDIRFSECLLGRFGSRIDEDARVESGDRIEVYRPLHLSPKEIRHRRAGLR